MHDLLLTKWYDFFVLLADFFRGVEVTKIRLGGLDHVMSFVANEDEKIYIRIYRFERN